MLETRYLILALGPLLPFALACSSSTDGHASSGGASSGSGNAPAEASGAAGSATDEGGMAGASPDDALVVPEAVTVVPLAGGTGGFHMLALTLVQGPSNIEVYAALKNEGDLQACAASISVELFDKDQLSLSAAVGGAYAKHLYRRTDGSGEIASCVAPGEVAMAAITGFGSPVAVEDVAYVVYRCPNFALDVVAIGGFSVDQVKSATSDTGTSYTGVFVNGLDLAVTAPQVSIFPVNRVGRPLGLATAESTVEVPPGGSWAFETSRVNAFGSDYSAYSNADTAN
ncbi:MAG: hypothetical protein WDO69_10445 [Pseudomonadota bacterium]